MGGAGVDVLNGAEHRDVLDGGADTTRDVFVFARATHSAVGDLRDVIRHFTPGLDDLNVTLMDANSQSAGNQNFTFNGTAAKANAVWYTAATGGIIVKGDVTGDRVADFEIKLEGITGISAGDFIL